MKGPAVVNSDTSSLVKSDARATGEMKKRRSKKQSKPTYRLVQVPDKCTRMYDFYILETNNLGYEKLALMQKEIVTVEGVLSESAARADGRFVIFKVMRRRTQGTQVNIDARIQEIFNRVTATA